MSLRHSYTVLAPLYDRMVAAPTRSLRRRSLERLAPQPGEDVLLCGIGSGLDIPLLPPGPRYTGIDLTPGMLRRAARRARRRPLDIQLCEGDVMRLPFPDQHFDAVIMHLILAVVPEPSQALREAARVLRPGGRILVLDKFLRPGERAWLRRLLNPLLRRIATRLDVVFEDLLAACGDLDCVEDTPADATGWFRHIVLLKQAGTA